MWQLDVQDVTIVLCPEISLIPQWLVILPQKKQTNQYFNLIKQMSFWVMTNNDTNKLIILHSV